MMNTQKYQKNIEKRRKPAKQECKMKNGKNSNIQFPRQNDGKHNKENKNTILPKKQCKMQNAEIAKIQFP